MNVYCIVMFKFNYSVGDIKNSDLGEGIVCLGEGSGGKGILISVLFYRHTHDQKSKAKH